MENITKERAKKIIYKTFSMKNISPERIRKVYKLLKLFKEDDKNKFFYNHCMAKLLMKQGKYIDAKYYLLEEIYNGIEKNSTYYQLFKIDVYEKKFIDAYLDLYKFKEGNKNFNVSFPLTLVEICNDINYDINLFLKTDYTISITNQLFDLYFESEEQNIYQEILKDFNNRRFDLVETKLNRLNDIINDKNLSIDVTFLIETIKYINKKINKLYLDEFAKNKCFKQNPKFKVEILNTINTGKFSISTILYCINRMIDLDLNSAKISFERLQQLYCLEDYQYEVMHIKNRIAENKKYLELTEDQKRVYKLCLEKEKTSYNYYLNNALYYNELGKKFTNHPIFDLEIAITLYNLNHYKEAIEHIKAYLAVAGNKKIDALFLLRSIALKEQNVQDIRSIEKEIIKYKKAFEKNDKFIANYTNIFNLFNIKEINENTTEDILTITKERKISFKEILKCIEKLLSTDPSLAQELFTRIEKVYSFDNYEVVSNYLKKKIKEKVDYINLTQEEKKLYELYSRKAKEAYKEGDYNLAIDYYEAGKYITNHPYFNYRIGLCYYMMYEYDTARKYLLEYLANGGKKEILALTFLSNIEINSKNIPMAIEYQKRAKLITYFYDKQDRSYLLERNFLKQQKSKKRKNRKKEDIDVLKNKVSKTLKMTKEEFTKDELDISLYDSYITTQKLAIIKSLYQDKKIATADKMLKELEKITADKEERKKITCERKRKVLYINQSKGKIDKR